MLIVFTTGLINFMCRGYDVRAFQFMIKPIKEKEFDRVMDNAREALENVKSDTFVIRQEGKFVKFMKDEVVYLKMDGHYVIAHTTRGVYRYKGILSLAEKALGMPHFCRCHRSYLVNLYHVQTINRELVQMDDGTCLPVSRGGWTSLNECFIKYFTRA
jgi:DNA-binding LytR/AlgR family response regulator